MSYDIYVDLLRGTPYSSPTSPSGSSSEPYKYLYDIKQASDNAVIQSDDDVNVNLIYDSTFRETLHVPFTVNSGKTFTVLTSDSTSGQATITGADLVGGFKLPASLDSDEKITDGGVEIWSSSTQLTNWEHYGGSYGTISRVSNNVQSGNYSVKLTRTGASPYGILQFGETLTDSTDYRLSLIYYAQDATTAVPSVYIVRGASKMVGSYLQTTNTWSGAVPTGGVPMTIVQVSSKWGRAIIDFTTSSGSPDTYTILISTFGIGKYVIVDSISLRELEESDGLGTLGDGASLYTNIISNSSFETWGGAAPDDWTVGDVGAGASYSKETGTTYHGDNAIKVVNAAAGTKRGRQQITLEANTTYKLTIAHMEQLNSKTHYDATAKSGVAIVRGTWTGAGDVYWTPIGWTSLPLGYYWPLTQRQYWGVDEIEFTTSTETTYHIAFMGAYSYGVSAVVSQYYDHYFDYVQVGRADEDTDDYTDDPQMLAWDIDGKLVHYEHIDKSNDNVPWKSSGVSYENSLVSEADVPRFEGIGKGATLYHWHGEDVGIYQRYALTDAVTYRAQVFANIHNTYSVSSNPIYMMIVKDLDTNPRYWNATSKVFQTTAVNAASLTSDNWDIMSVEFTANGTTDYSVVIHSGEISGGIAYDGYEIFIDELSLILTESAAGVPSDDEIYHAYFDWPNDRDTTDYDTWKSVTTGSPYQLYVTGTLRQLDVEGYQLHKEAVFTDHPRRMCWSYDEPNRILYMNIGEDPADITIEAVVRSRAANTGTNATPSVGNSRVTISDIACQKSIYDCIRIREHTATRQSDVTIEYCIIEDAGTSSIASGYRDPTDYTATQNQYYTCSDVTIDNCKCYRGNAASITNRDSYGGDYSSSSTVKYWTENDIDIAVGNDWNSNSLLATGDDAVSQTIQNCLVQGLRPYINSDYYNNGISVSTGRYIYVYDNEVTKVNHGIVIVGQYTNPSGSGVSYGDARYVEIKGNYVHRTGDDSLWLAGINDYTDGNSKVCFNIFARSKDNNFEVLDCLGIEIYNNIFHDAFNQQLGIYRSTLDCLVFVFNNIFDYWNEYLKDDGIHGGHIGGAGAAIGFAGHTSSYVYAWNVMDNNLYFSDPDKSLAKSHVFNINGTTYTKDQWKAIEVNDPTFGYHKSNFDRRSLFWSDPKFVDRDTLDFRLQHDSPCIDAGLVIKNIREQINIGSYFIQFDNVNNHNSLIDPDTSWPYNVQFIDGDSVGPENTMDLGPYAYATIKTIYTALDSSGDAVEGLTGIIDSYKTGGGEDITPVPEIYELGDGMYGFAARITKSMSIRIDKDSTDSQSWTSDLRYRYVTIDPDAEYLKILTESTQDVGSIYQNTIDLKASATAIESDTEEVLGLAFKNSIRKNRKYEMIEGELRLTYEELFTYKDSSHSIALHKYIIEYDYTGEKVKSMTVTTSY